MHPGQRGPQAHQVEAQANHRPPAVALLAVGEQAQADPRVPVCGVEELRRFRDSGPWGGSPIHFEQERYFDAAGLASVTGSVANTFPLRMTQHNDRHRARRGRASGASGPTPARDIVGRARNETGVTSGLVVGRAPRL